jgi:serine/threonine-protein kinase HipA
MRIKVQLWSRQVGILADDAAGAPGIAFQFNRGWLADGVPISPIRMRWSDEVQWNRNPRPFDGLFGVFSDSLPDSWGQRLMDERFRRAGLNPEKVGVLERLCYVGIRGWGALAYSPDRSDKNSVKLEKMDIAETQRSAKAAVEGRMSDILPQVIESGASTGGARPKQRIAISGKDRDAVWYGKTLPPKGFDPWILKIETDPGRQYGRVEKAYYRLAGMCSLHIPETRLVRNHEDEVDHFAIKRFDWMDGRRLHCHTLAGLLHADSHDGSTDYADFFRAVLQVTEDQSEVVEAFRRMVFNVSFGVRDDHAKNHAFTMNEEGRWHLSPAYDVMYSRPGTGNGLHRQMAVSGKRSGIDRSDIESLARLFSVKRQLKDIFESVGEAGKAWDGICRDLGIDEVRRDEIRDTWEFPNSDMSW